MWDAKLYGLEILRRLESDSDLIVSEGTIYPLLSRLKTLGLVGSEWVESEAGHPGNTMRYPPKTASSGDDGDLDAVFIEDEQITCSRREGKVDD